MVAEPAATPAHARTEADFFRSPTGLVHRGHWWAELREDVARYAAHHDGSTARAVVLECGVWALAQYRIASGVHRSRLPRWQKAPLLAGLALTHKLAELVTGMSLPHRADLGPGLYLGHFGPVVVHAEAVVGAGCNLSQGTAIGVSGRGSRRGVPVLGDRVYVGANAVVAGRIRIGDDVVVAACSLVTRDVPDRVTVLGVPAVVVDELGTAGMGLHQHPRRP